MEMGFFGKYMFMELVGGGTCLINKPLQLQAGVLKTNVCFPVEVL